MLPGGTRLTRQEIGRTGREHGPEGPCLAACLVPKVEATRCEQRNADDDGAERRGVAVPSDSGAWWVA